MTESSFESRLAALRDDREHGAAELARTALEFAAAEAREAEAGTIAKLAAHLHDAAESLAATRPSMAPLANLLTAWSQALGRITATGIDGFRSAAAQAAATIAERSLAAGQHAAVRMAALVEDGATVMTHSLSSTVTATFRELRGRSVKAIITESRPGNEGHLLAARLSEWKIPTTLITDAAMALSVPEANLVVVGADSILPDGSVVNKAGTCLLALAAREHGVPFYVCAESFKRRPDHLPPVELEAMDPSELGAPALPGVEPSNVYFDLTPARLVTAVITEEEENPRQE